MSSGGNDAVEEESPFQRRKGRRLHVQIKRPCAHSAQSIMDSTCPGDSQDLIVTVVSLTLSPRNSKSCVSVIMEF